MTAARVALRDACVKFQNIFIHLNTCMLCCGKNLFVFTYVVRLVIALRVKRQGYSTFIYWKANVHWCVLHFMIMVNILLRVSAYIMCLICTLSLHTLRTYLYTAHTQYNSACFILCINGSTKIHETVNQSMKLKYKKSTLTKSLELFYTILAT